MNCTPFEKLYCETLFALHFNDNSMHPIWHCIIHSFTMQFVQNTYMDEYMGYMFVDGDHSSGRIQARCGSSMCDVSSIRLRSVGDCNNLVMTLTHLCNFPPFRIFSSPKVLGIQGISGPQFLFICINRCSGQQVQDV